MSILSTTAAFPEQRLFRSLAVMCGILVIANLSINMSAEDLSEIFWFCNIASILVVIGLWFGQQTLVTAVLIAAIPAQGLWIVDFVLQMFGLGIGRTAWLFGQANDVVFALSTGIHLVLIPVCLLAVNRRGYSQKALPIAIVGFGCLLVATYVWTDMNKNINCIFYPCDLSMRVNGAEIRATPAYLGPMHLFTEALFWFCTLIFTNYCARQVCRRLGWRLVG